MRNKTAKSKKVAKPKAAGAARLGQRDIFKFIKACWSGQTAVVRQWLRAGVDPNVMYENTGRRPLSAAAAGGHAAVAKLLLDAGADPHRPDSWKAMPPDGTPLENACRNGHLKVAKLLVDRGAKVNMKGLHTPLWTAASCGHSDVVEFLLRAGAPFDQSAFGQAVWRGEAKTVALLRKAGAADVNARNDVGEGLVHTAAGRKSADVMRLLIAAGADVNVASTIQKHTPLHVAARWGNIEVLRVLLEAGASIDALNHKKKTAEQWARAFEHPEAAAFLKGWRRGTEATAGSAGKAGPMSPPPAQPARTQVAVPAARGGKGTAKAKATVKAKAKRKPLPKVKEPEDDPIEAGDVAGRRGTVQIWSYDTWIGMAIRADDLDALADSLGKVKAVREVRRDVTAAALTGRLAAPRASRYAVILKLRGHAWALLDQSGSDPWSQTFQAELSRDAGRPACGHQDTAGASFLGLHEAGKRRIHFESVGGYEGGGKNDTRLDSDVYEKTWWRRHEDENETIQSLLREQDAYVPMFSVYEAGGKLRPSAFPGDTLATQNVERAMLIVFAE